MTSPFKDVTVRIDAYGYRHIVWSLEPQYTYPADCTLKLQYGRAGSDTWQTLSSSLIDVCQYIDYTVRNYNKRVNDYYRLTLHSPSSNQTYVSGPFGAGRGIAYPASATVKNLIRLAQKEFQQSGRPGVLLKKKLWGTPCPDCKTFDDDQCVNEHCQTCLGTGIVGGYYKGIPMTILQQNSQRVNKVMQTGLQQADTLVAKCIAWPWIHQGDVWADSQTNQRYIISAASPLSKYKHIPIILQIQMNKLQLTDVLHSDTANAKFAQEDTTQFVEQNDDWDLQGGGICQ